MTKKMFTNFLISSICYIALGIALMVWPIASLNVFCYVIGSVTVAYGLWRIYRFVTHREERYVTVGLFVGIVALALGLCLFIKPEIFSSILPMILGLYLVFDGMVKLQAAFDIKRDGYEKWGILLLLALLMIALGVVIILNPFDSATVLVAFIGASMVVDGAINLWNAIVVYQHLKALKKAAKEVVETAGAVAEELHDAAMADAVVTEVEAEKVSDTTASPAESTTEAPKE